MLEFTKEMEAWNYVLDNKNYIYKQMHNLNITFNFEDIFNSTTISLVEKLNKGKVYGLNDIIIKNTIKNVLKKEYKHIKRELHLEDLAGDMTC